jgi:hypothetical protein
MLIIKPDSLPPLWWLNPWSVCRQLHRNANALKALADRQDDLLRGKYTERPRWQIVHNEDANGVRYYFHDTDPELHRGKPNIQFRGKSFLYDGPSKYFAFETDPAKAVERVTELNSR